MDVIVTKIKRPGGRQSSGRMSGKGSFNPVDVHVGQRLRLKRSLLGFSQETLGDRIGLTFQQVQKYESGMNRVSASRLYDLSEVLDVPIAYFFEDMSSSTKAQSPSKLMGLDPQSAEQQEPNQMARRETLELVRAYYKISVPSVRQRITELVRALGRAEFTDDKM